MNYIGKLFSADRTAVSLSPREFAILNVISSHESTGICVADVSSEIAVAMGREPRLTTIYELTLGLEKKGLITESGFNSNREGRPRKLFKLTKYGIDAKNVGNMISGKFVAA